MDTISFAFNSCIFKKDYLLTFWFTNYQDVLATGDQFKAKREETDLTYSIPSKEQGDFLDKEFNNKGEQWFS